MTTAEQVEHFRGMASNHEALRFDDPLAEGDHPWQMNRE